MYIFGNIASTLYHDKNIKLGLTYHFIKRLHIFKIIINASHLYLIKNAFCEINVLNVPIYNHNMRIILIENHMLFFHISHISSRKSAPIDFWFLDFCEKNFPRCIFRWGPTSLKYIFWILDWKSRKAQILQNGKLQALMGNDITYS